MNITAITKRAPTQVNIESSLNRLRSLLPIYKKVHEAFTKCWREISSTSFEIQYETAIQICAKEFNISTSDVEDILVGDPFDALGEEFWNYGQKN